MDVYLGRSMDEDIKAEWATHMSTRFRKRTRTAGAAHGSKPV